MNADANSLAEIRQQIRKILASDAVPKAITVHLANGVYQPNDFCFTAEDSSERCVVHYIGGSATIIDGGVTVAKDAWQKPDSDMAERFAPEVRDSVFMIDLSTYGFGRKDWGGMQAVGGFETSRKYPNRERGVNCQFFCGEERMTLARYPNTDYAEIEAVMDVGQVAEFPPHNYFADWVDCVEPRGGCYVMDPPMAKRVANWKMPADIWMFGYFYWDWADSSTPVTLDAANRRIFPTYASTYGCRSGAHYYFYNVAEELDIAGEWYLDRDTAKLYFYPSDGETVSFTCRKQPLISCTNTCNLHFENLTLQNTAGNAVEADGNRLEFCAIDISKIGGNGIRCNGYNNVIRNCSVSFVGEGGILVDGGDRQTLTAGNNRVTNCQIFDFAQIHRTYRPGISLAGVGNRCDGNDIRRTPHMAIYYRGNQHLIENNYICDAVTDSRDAGAIYGGRDWASHGTVIRNNVLECIGSEEFRPAGIYWDDGLSGQTAYGNILADVGAQGFLIGGGRENIVVGNVLIRCGTALHYDDRYRDGFLYNGWAKHAVLTYRGDQWKSLEAVPYTSEVWRKQYPRLAQLVIPFDTPDDADFPVNPSYSVVKNNVIIHSNADGQIGIAESVYRYSEVGENPIFPTVEAAGWDFEKREPILGGPAEALLQAAFSELDL